LEKSQGLRRKPVKSGLWWSDVTRPCVYLSTFLEAGWVNVFKIHSPETVAENSSMFVLAKFPGAKLVHVWKTN